MSFIYKAKSVGALQKQGHLLCTQLTKICGGTANIFMLLPDLLVLKTALTDSSEHPQMRCIPMDIVDITQSNESSSK